MSRPGRKKPNILLVVVFVLLAVLICLRISGLQIYPDGFAGKDIAKLVAETRGKVVFYGSVTEAPQKEDIYVMYSGLSEDDKCVYDMFLDLTENAGGTDYTGVVVVPADMREERRYEYFWNIYYAMVYDHPEYFYLITEDAIAGWEIDSDVSSAYVFYMETVSEDNIRKMDILRNAAKAFLSDIDLAASDEEKELAIHDKLIDTVSYDYELAEKNFDPESNWDQGATAYGALVENSSGEKNMTVCSGYSLAFEYLMHEAGIPCAYVTGTATSESSDENGERTEDHAWNVVRIGDDWYEVDVTWDDRDYAEFGEDFDAQIKGDEEKYFNTRHHFYNRSTSEMESLEATDDTLYNLEGYDAYNTVEFSYHKRGDADSPLAEPIDVFCNSLVPICE